MSSGSSRSRVLVIAVVAAVLVAGGAALFLVADGLPGRTARAVGGNAPVDALRAGDPLDSRAANSPAVAADPANPANLVVVNRVDNPKFGCSLYLSTNGGATWTEGTAPGAPGAPPVTCFSPDAAFGPDGILYVSFTSAAPVPGEGTVPDAAWLAASHDGGHHFGAPVRVSGPLAFHLRMATDPSAPGRVYLSWLQAAATGPWGIVAGDNPIVVSRSDDGGASWGAPVRVSPPERHLAIAPALAVGANGEVLVAYVDAGNDRLDYEGAHEGKGGDPYAGNWALVTTSSTDGAATWRESVVDSHLVPARRFIQLFPPTPALAVDRARRRAYVGFADGRANSTDVWVWASSDGGRAWGPARRVNDVTPGDQYLPTLAVAPDGRLDVAYYDRRADPANVMNETSLQSSYDGGTAFGRRVRVSDHAFDSRIGFGSDRQLPELGSRLGLVSRDGGTLVLWADTRAGQVASSRQDLAHGVVAFSQASGAKGPLDVLAVAGLVAGAVLGGLTVVLAARRRRESAGQPL